MMVTIVVVVMISTTSVLIPRPRVKWVNLGVLGGSKKTK